MKSSGPTSSFWNEDMFPELYKNKTINTLYHFIDIDQVFNMTDEQLMFDTSKQIFDYIIHNTKISTTKDYCSPCLNFNKFEWNTRITIHNIDKIDVLPNLYIKPFIKQIDIRVPDSSFEDRVNTIMYRCREMNIPCNIVRSFDKVY